MKSLFITILTCFFLLLVKSTFAQYEQEFKDRASFVIDKTEQYGGSKPVGYKQCQNGDYGKFLHPKIVGVFSKGESSAYYKDATMWMNTQSSCDMYHFNMFGYPRILYLFPNEPSVRNTAKNYIGAAMRNDSYGIQYTEGTQNHLIMTKCSGFLMCQYAQENFTGISSWDVVTRKSIIKMWLKWFSKTLFEKGEGEFNSTNYEMYNVEPWLNLYDFSHDKEVKDIAKSVLDYFACRMALTYRQGQIGGADMRGNGGSDASFKGSAGYLGWLWFGDSPCADMSALETKYFPVNIKEYTTAIYAATSTYRPPQQAVALAKGEVAMPAMFYNSYPTYDMNTPSFIKSTLYRDKQYSLGAAYFPYGGFTAGSYGIVSWKLLATGNKLTTKSIQYVSGCGYDKGDGQGRFPYDQFVHHKNVLIQMTKISADYNSTLSNMNTIVANWKTEWENDFSSRFPTDTKATSPGNPVKESSLVGNEPNNSYLFIKSNGGMMNTVYSWNTFFVEMDSVFLAIHTLTGATPSVVSTTTGCKLIDEAGVYGKICGFVMETSNKNDFANFNDFMINIHNFSNLDLSLLNTNDSLIYISAAGDLINAKYTADGSWIEPIYDWGFGVKTQQLYQISPPFWQPTPGNPGLITPYPSGAGQGKTATWKVNSVPVNLANTWDIISGSNLSVKNKKLIVSDNSSTYTIDYNGVKPVFSQQTSYLSAFGNKLNFLRTGLPGGFINIASNIKWTVSCSENWVQVNSNSFTGNTQLLVTAQTNATGSVRYAQISVFASGVNPVYLSVFQDTITAIPSFSGTDFFNDENSVTVTTGVSQTRVFDIDNDNLQDLIVYDFSTKTKVFKNKGNFKFNYEQDIYIKDDYLLFDFFLNDYNNNNYTDMLYSGTLASNSMSKMTNIDCLEFNSMEHIFVKNRPLRDMNQDGSQDMIGRVNNDTYIYLNQRDTTFKKQIKIPTPLLTNDWYSADFDNDGNEDLLTLYEKDVYFYKNDGNGNFIFLDSKTIETNVKISSVDVGDGNGDGKLDILLTCYDISFVSGISDSYSIQMLENTGDFNFTEKIIQFGFGTFTRLNALFGDFNQDGKTDILVSHITTYLLINTPTGFIKTSDFLNKDGVPILADLDNDNKLDLQFYKNGFNPLFSMVSRNVYSFNNLPPSPPTQLSYYVDNYDVTITWNDGYDATTPIPALSYNARAGITSDGVEILSPMSDLKTGKLRVTSLGNQELRKFMYLRNLPNEDSVYFSVQAIDASFSPSVFSKTIAFAPNPMPTVQASDISVTDISEQFMSFAWKNGNGHRRAVFIAKNPTTADFPKFKNTYSANPNVGWGSNLSSEWFCIYNGTGNTCTVLNPTQLTNYTVKVFEYNGLEGFQRYNTLIENDNPYSFNIGLFNDAPVATIPNQINSFEDNIYSFEIKNIDDNNPEAVQNIQVKLQLFSDKISILSVNYFPITQNSIISFLPKQNWYGTATIKLTIRDDGGTKYHDFDSLVKILTYNVLPVNDSPQITSKSKYEGDESFDINLFDISVSDVDLSGNDIIKIEMNIINGLLNWNNQKIKYLSDNIQLQNANEYFKSLYYVSDKDFFGMDTLYLTIKDLGQIGLGGELKSSVKIPIKINPVAPLILAKPDTIKLCAGVTKNIGIKTRGTTLKYTWKKNNLPFIENYKDSIALAPADVTQSGTYTCDVTNGWGSETAKFVLDIRKFEQQITVKNQKCLESNSGEILITTKSGFEPYTFNLNGAKVNPKNENLRYGIYSVNITDNIGCRFSNAYQIIYENQFPVSSVAVVYSLEGTRFYNKQYYGDSTKWDFGDGTTTQWVNVKNTVNPFMLSPLHKYLHTGIFEVKLMSKNQCGIDTFTFIHNSNPNAINDIEKDKIKIYAIYGTSIICIENITNDKTLEMFDMLGRKVFS